jgi:hypothetical protein
MWMWVERKVKEMRLNHLKFDELIIEKKWDWHRRNAVAKLESLKARESFSAG